MQPATAAYVSLLTRITIEHVRSLKARPRRDAQTETRLVARLQDLFDEAAAELVADVRSRNAVPGDAMTQQLIASRIEDLLDAYVEAITEEALSAAEFGEQRTNEAARQSGAMKHATKQAAELLADQIREGAFEASRRTLARMFGNVIEILAGAAEEGLGIDETATRLEEAFVGMRRFELIRVARTELNSAQNLAAHETIVELGIEFEQWVSAKDSRVRDSHRDLDGQITRTGERFSNGLRYPGDRSGDIEEWINCRCRSVPYLIPMGKIAPLNRRYFYESDLVEAA